MPDFKIQYSQICKYLAILGNIPRSDPDTRWLEILDNMMHFMLLSPKLRTTLIQVAIYSMNCPFFLSNFKQVCILSFYLTFSMELPTFTEYIIIIGNNFYKYTIFPKMEIFSKYGNSPSPLFSADRNEL